MRTLAVLLKAACESSPYIYQLSFSVENCNAVAHRRHVDIKIKTT